MPLSIGCKPESAPHALATSLSMKPGAWLGRAASRSNNWIPESSLARSFVRHHLALQWICAADLSYHIIPYRIISGRATDPCSCFSRMSRIAQVTPGRKATVQALREKAITFSP